METVKVLTVMLTKMNRRKSPFNAKTVVTGILLSILMVVMAQYSVNIVQGSFMAIDHMPAGGIFIFFILVLFLNPLLKLLTKGKAGFSPAELLFIYTMVLVSASVAEMGLGCQLLPILATPGYFSTSTNRWGELIAPWIKNWLAPSDPVVIARFFEGNPAGAGIPWGAWALPLFSWGIFLMLLYFVTICAVSILRKEWVERERIAFPLVQLPIAMVEPSKGKVPALFLKKIFWVAFSISFLLAACTALNKYFPVLPAPQFLRYVPLFRRTTTLVIRLSFPVLGFCFFVKRDVAFSLWFFNLLFLVAIGWFNITGISSPENIGAYGAGGNAIMGNLGSGAFISFAFISLYTARGHLKNVFRKATGRAPEVDDSREILPYKTAVWGMTAGFILLMLWLKISGMSFWLSLPMLLLAFIFWFGLTRVIAEGRLPTIVAPSIASSQLISGLGSSTLGQENMVALGLSYVYHGDLRTFPASSTMHSAKISQEFGKYSLKPFFWAMMGALFIGFTVSSVMVLHMAYANGGLNLQSGFFNGSNLYPFQHISDYLKTPSSPNAAGWIARCIGAAGLAVLSILQARFLWWPLHPIGFTVGMVWLVNQLWFSIFLAWLIKTLLLKAQRHMKRGNPSSLDLFSGNTQQPLYGLL